MILRWLGRFLERKLTGMLPFDYDDFDKYVDEMGERLTR